jgi:outer membrane beta-barrel protein
MRNSARCKVLLMAAVGAWPILASAADREAADAQAVAQAADQPVVTPQAVPEPATPQPTDREIRRSDEQVIEPRIDRRNVKVTHIPSNDFELGVFTGTYSTQYLGSDLVGGVRLGYHITEDFFSEAVYGNTRVTDEAFRQILPGGIFTNREEKLSYYELSFGVNVLPGEVYFWKHTAMPSAIYLIAGLGSTKIADQRHFTVSAGLGVRVWLADWASLQADMRDHIFSLDVLGLQRSTQNLEFTGGVTFFF